MQTTYDFAGSTDMWSTSAGGHLMKVVNLTGFTVLIITQILVSSYYVCNRTTNYNYHRSSSILSLMNIIRIPRTNCLLSWQT